MIPKQRYWTLASIVFASLTTVMVLSFERRSILAAEETSPAKVNSRQADVDAIKKSSEEFSKAFEKGDAKAVAAFWTENGEYHSDSDGSIIGRANLEKAFAAHFKAKTKARIDVDVHSIHFPSRDIAIEEGMLRARSHGAELPSSTYYSTLHVREDGQWKIAISREWGASEDKLEDLAWLIGDWSAKSKNGEVAMSFQWNKPRNMISSRFMSKEGDVTTASGHQTIRFDPAMGRLRSWTFSDDGSHGESLWSRDGARWVMESVGVTSKGVETTSLNIITRINENEFTWQSIERTVGGSPSPDTTPVKIVRVKPEK